MRRDLALLVCAGLLAGAGRAPAQATGTPTFNAPYRAFQRSEIGVLLSFPNGGGTAVEGAYRMASGRLDLGFRVGFFDPPGPGSAEAYRSEEHTSELQSQSNLVCRLLLEKKKTPVK